MDRNDLEDLKNIDQEKIRRRRNRRRKKRAGKKKRTVLLIVLAIVLVSGFYVARQEAKIISLKKQKKEITEQISDEKIKNQELQEEIDNSDSRSYIEYLARKYLKLIYPDEKIYVPKDKGEK
jgi:cell division protein FtsL